MPQGKWEGGSVKIAACRGSAAHFFWGVQKEVIWVIVYDMKSASLTVHHGMLQYRCLEHFDLATQIVSPDTDKIMTFYTPCLDTYKTWIS